MTRTIIRRALAAGILLFTWYTASRVQDQAAEAPLLATVSASLLFLMLVALSNRRRT